MRVWLWIVGQPKRNATIKIEPSAGESKGF